MNNHPNLAIVLVSVQAADPEDSGLIESEANRLLHQGWSVSDVRAWLGAMEEVNPDLPEGVALARMRKLRAKYETVRS